MPPIFALLQEGGDLAPAEMARTFNCGVGMAVIIAEAERGAFSDDGVFELGQIESGQRGCTVRGRAGTWNSPEDWSATHNA
jgi:phosphoribosylformylglycinamidine cyclo-ligase